MREQTEHREQTLNGQSQVDTPREDRRLLLPVKEVAPLIGISRWTIYRRIREGVWPTVRCGRKHGIPREFVDGLLTEIHSKAASEGVA